MPPAPTDAFVKVNVGPTVIPPVNVSAVAVVAKVTAPLPVQVVVPPEKLEVVPPNVGLFVSVPVIVCGPSANVTIPAFATVMFAVEDVGKLTTGVLLKFPLIVTPAVEANVTWPVVLAVNVPLLTTLPDTVTAPAAPEVTIPVPLLVMLAIVVAAVKTTVPELALVTAPTVVAAVAVIVPVLLLVRLPVVVAAVIVIEEPLFAVTAPVAVAWVRVSK